MSAGFCGQKRYCTPLLMWNGRQVFLSSSDQKQQHYTEWLLCFRTNNSKAKLQSETVFCFFFHPSFARRDEISAKQTQPKITATRVKGSARHEHGLNLKRKEKRPQTCLESVCEPQQPAPTKHYLAPGPNIYHSFSVLLKMILLKDSAYTVRMLIPFFTLSRLKKKKKMSLEVAISFFFLIFSTVHFPLWWFH